MFSKLDIWDWPLYTEAERAQVIKNADEAYKLLKIPKSSTVYDNLSNKSTAQKAAAAAKKRSKLEEQQRRMLNPSKRGTSVTPKAKSKLSVPTNNKPENNKRRSPSPYPPDLRSDTDSESIHRPKSVKSMSEHTPIPVKLQPIEVSHSPTIAPTPTQTQASNSAKISNQKKFSAFCRSYMMEQRAHQELKLQVIQHEAYSALKEHRTKRIKLNQEAENLLDRNQGQNMTSFNDLLNTLCKKRERIFYMRTVIEKNKQEFKFSIPKECLLQQLENYTRK